MKIINYLLLFVVTGLLVFLLSSGLLAKERQVKIISDFKSPGIETLVKTALEYAISLYGQPKITPQSVYLKTGKSPYTTLENANQGQFSIYLSRKPNEYAFLGQLSHEVSHLLNARLFDCYVEGQSTLFAEQFLTHKRLDWSGWMNYFKQGNEPFYGQTYFMMREVAAAAGETAMRQFLSFATNNNSDIPWMYIDINRWLASLPSNKRLIIRNIILRYYSQVSPTLNSVDARYVCLKPNKL